MDAPDPRKRLIVEAEDRDHFMRYEAHRNQCRHSDLASTEVRSGGAGAEEVCHHRTDIRG